MTKPTLQEFKLEWQDKTCSKPPPEPEHQKDITGPRPVLSEDIQKWPEYRALMRRMGADVQTPLADVILKIQQGELVTVECSCLAVDMEDGDAG